MNICSGKIAIIGANEPLIPFYQQTKSLGYEIHSFAWENGAICKQYSDFFYPISFIEKEQILKICKKNNIQGITSFSLESALPTVNYIAKKLRLHNNSDECILLTEDKFTMREQMKKCGIKIPKYYIITSEKEINSLNIRFPVILKPIDSGGSRGVTKVTHQSDLAFAFLRAIHFSKKRKVLVEEFIEGREFSVEYISHKGIHYFIAITDKITTGHPYFVELEHHQPAQISDTVKEDIKKITVQTLEALKITYGASHTEIKMDNNGDLYIIELGNRMGGDMITSDLVRLSTGYDFVKGVLELSMGNFTPPNICESGYAGIYYLSADSFRVKHFLDNPQFYPEIIKAEYLKDELIKPKESNDRTGYIIYKSDKKFLLK